MMAALGQDRVLAVALAALTIGAIGATSAAGQEPQTAQDTTLPGAAAADTIAAGAAAAPADSASVSAGGGRVDAATLDELLRPTISPTKAVLMTPIWPGWGQLYAKNTWRAALAFGLETFYLSNLLMNDRKAVRISDIADQLPADDPRQDLFNSAANEYWERMRDFGWWYLGGMLIVALDAYVGAHLFEFDEDRLPVPDNWPEQESPPQPTVADTMAAPTVLVFQWRFGF